MKVEICKWYGGAVAPVVLMIDDLCNVWVDANGNGIIDPGEDWGYAGRGQNSSLVFLEEKLLKYFPQVKVTFFVPVGIRAGVVENPAVHFISRMINYSPEAKEFFRSVSDNPRYEVAYHGTTHGKPGKEAKDFIQEWETYDNLEQAKEVINAGKDIFREVFGVYPAGGKYCGYVANSFSDDSIDQSGFSWWCRYCNVGLDQSGDCAIGGEDFNQLTNFDVKYFGKNNVLDIPTTLHGSLLSSVLNPGAYNLKGIAKRFLKILFVKMKLKKLDYLLENHLVVCIQEHIAPARVDGRRQTPNIFDDLHSLRTIMQYLKRRKVWYCTCSELARYVAVRDNTKIECLSGRTFDIRTESPLAAGGGVLTLILKSVQEGNILQPDGTLVTVCNHLADIKVMNGIYALV